MCNNSLRARPTDIHCTINPKNYTNLQLTQYKHKTIQKILARIFFLYLPPATFESRLFSFNAVATALISVCPTISVCWRASSLFVFALLSTINTSSSESLDTSLTGFFLCLGLMFGTITASTTLLGVVCSLGSTVGMRLLSASLGGDVGASVNCKALRGDGLGEDLAFNGASFDGVSLSSCNTKRK